MKIFVFLFSIALWQIGLFKPFAPKLGGDITIAEATHNSNGNNGNINNRGNRGNRGNVNNNRGNRGNNGNIGRGNRPNRGNCRGGNRRRCQPPTVSELPIQYMVLSGASTIALAGGMVFYIRKRKMKNSPEA